MSKVKHNVVLDILNPQWPPEIHLCELDSGHQICFHIAGMDLTGYTATIWVVKPSGKRVWNNCTVNNQCVIADITNQMLAENGLCVGQIKLKSTADGLVTPCDFVLKVRRDRSGDGLESKNESTVIESMICDVMENMGIDATLTKTGYAADAAVVGRKFGELSGQIEELEESGIGGSGGQPIVVKTASAMTDTTAIYLYMGEGETVNGVVYEYGYIYTYDTDTSTWANSGLYGKGKDGKDGADGKDGENGTATDEQVNKYVGQWLEEHLEVTIEDGSITYDKLAEEVKMKVLPAVAEADNGKILQVVNGEWALVEPNFGGADLTEIAELVGGDA